MISTFLKKSIVCLLSCAAIFYAAPLYGSQGVIKHSPPVPTSVNYTFSVGETTVEPESELIMINNTLMVPLRDFTRELNLKVRHLKKDDTYKLSFNHLKTTALIVPNSQEMWVNHRKQYLNQAPIEYQRRLYVPFYSTFRSLPINVAKVSTHNYTLSVLDKDPKNAHKTDDIIRNTDNLVLPQLEKDRPLFLSFGDSIHDIQDLFIQKNNIVFVNIDPFIKKEGFKVYQSTTEYRMSSEKYVISWTKNSRNVSFSRLKETRPFFKPIYKNNAFYVPLPSLIVGLNRDLHWDPKTRIITLLNRITNISIAGSAPKPSTKHTENKVQQTIETPFKLTIEGVQSIPYDKPKRSFWGQGYTIKFPYTLSQLSKKKIKEINDDIKTKATNVAYIDLINHKNEFSELSIGFKYANRFPYIKQTNNMLDISFLNTIDKVEGFENQDKAIVDIYMADTKKPKITYLSDPNRLVLDFNNVVHHVPEIQRYNFKAFSRIRSSVANFDNPKTRLVIDLKTEKPTYTIEQDDRRISILLSAPKKKKKTKKIELPKFKSKSQSKGLKNKVIVIDAGHGGRDPGGVGPHQEFEKKYTLDISRRLKNRLEEAGAYVIEVRNGDTNPTLLDRVKIANKNKADAFISVHINYFVNKNTQGTETYYYKFKDKALAKAIHAELATALKRPNRGVKRAKLYVLNHSKMPSALIEPLFITNPTELRLLKQPSTRQTIADATFRGIDAYFK